MYDASCAAHRSSNGEELGDAEDGRNCGLELIAIDGLKKKKKKSEKKRLMRNASSKRGGGDRPEDDQEEEEEEIRMQVTALDEVVNVNSFFTGAVFIGLSLSNDKSLVAKGPGDPCNASMHLLRQLVLLEVLAFSCFLMSSLVAQGLKLHLTICSLKLSKTASTTSNKLAARRPCALRLGVLATALGSVGGTIFLMLSIVIVIELRLGVLACDSTWSKIAVIPLLLLVSCGISVFIVAVLAAFRS